MSILNEQGSEVLDQTPVAVPAYIKKVDHRDSLREMIRQELSREAHDAGYETFEEADDFDVGDDYDPTSPYEEFFDPDTGVSNFDADYGNALPDETASNQSTNSEGGASDPGPSGTTGSEASEVTQ